MLSTLRPLLKTAPTRKCYRQIGGTLVERTVEDVVPSLETNFSGIKEVPEGLAKSYQSREKEFVSFQKEYGIQVRLGLAPHPSHLQSRPDVQLMGRGKWAYRDCWTGGDNELTENRWAAARLSKPDRVSLILDAS